MSTHDPRYNTTDDNFFRIDPPLDEQDAINATLCEAHWNEIQGNLAASFSSVTSTAADYMTANPPDGLFVNQITVTPVRSLHVNTVVDSFDLSDGTVEVSATLTGYITDVKSMEDRLLSATNTALLATDEAGTEKLIRVANIDSERYVSGIIDQISPAMVPGSTLKVVVKREFDLRESPNFVSSTYETTYTKPSTYTVQLYANP